MIAEQPAGPVFSGAVSQGDGGALVNVWAVPGASRTEITGLHGAAVKIRVTAAAEGGRANRALEQILSKLARAEVELVRGQSSRRKQFLVRGVSPAALADLIAGHAG
jgi:uncharacterized protein (TIGR00251 family)